MALPVKHFSWLLTFPLAVMVVVFAVANRAFVPLDLWPFAIEVRIPIFLLVLGSMLLGFLIGALVMWLSTGRQRRQSRAAKGRIAKLERQTRELEQARDRPETRSGAPAGPPAIRQPGDTNLPVA